MSIEIFEVVVGFNLCYHIMESFNLFYLYYEFLFIQQRFLEIHGVEICSLYFLSNKNDKNRGMSTLEGELHCENFMS